MKTNVFRFSTFGIVLVVLLAILSSAHAQPSPTIDNLVLQITEGQFNLYNADNAGQLSLIGDLEIFQIRGFFTPTLDARWEIREPSDIVVSPDGKHIAFMAFDFNNGEPMSALFIVSPSQDSLIQVAVPGMGMVSWLSDSASLLIYPFEFSTAYRDFEVSDIYLYQLATESLTALTSTPEYEPGVMWLLAAQRVLYIEPYTTCTPPCITATNLTLLTLDGNSTSLTDLGNQLPADIAELPYGWCWADQPVWSQVNSRLYYAVHCHYPGGDLPYDLIYSVSLDGNNRLEANLPGMFPDDEFITTVGIHPSPSSGDVYVLTASYNHNIPGGFLDLWRVLRVTGPEQVDIVVDPGEAVPNPVTSALSPDGQTLAFSSHASDGYLVTVDLGTGVATQLPTTLEGNICELQWQDNQRLLGIEYSGGCFTTYRQPESTWMFDTTSGAATNITAGLDGLVWVLPSER